MNTPYHLIVEGNPAIIYASRNGKPEKVLQRLKPFLKTFWQELETAGEHRHTPECLLAQLVVRFGFEICEDDYSNLRVGLNYDPDVEYLYWISLDRHVKIWTPEPAYRQNPNIGLKGCQQVEEQSLFAEALGSKLS